jgi:hypothetical protein
MRVSSSPTSAVASPSTRHICEGSAASPCAQSARTAGATRVAPIGITMPSSRKRPGTVLRRAVRVDIQPERMRWSAASTC